MKKDSKPPLFNQYESISPATKLLEKRRKMYQIHQAFEAQKEQFARYLREGKFKIQEDKLKDKDKRLQYDLTKFCQFLQDNQSKRKKAEEKSKLEQKTYLQKEEQIKSLEAQICELNKSQKRYHRKVVYLKKYEEYLEAVRSTYNDQYHEISDILTRYETLRKSNEEREQHRKRIEKEDQELKKQSTIEENYLNQSILTINNQLKELSRKIQDKTHQKNELQSEVECSNQEYSKKNLTMGKIFMAIDNLHYRCNQNSYKLKHEFNEKGGIEKKDSNKPKQMNKTKKIEGQVPVSKFDDNLSYQQKSKHAINKLKSIITHMKDLKAIIDEYKNYIKQQGKQEKYPMAL